ncbi:MAG TPA: hypothetical protein VMT34_06190, partial [Aggregatilineales bacterium]|nr:hypothetical protein [Aggregatilineales bacterium]
MREWRLTTGDPLAMRFAADARLTVTNYADDQTWELAFGDSSEPAFSVQTRYGGRVGLARVVPMIVIEGRTPIYEAGSFAERPVLRAFAPNYARLSARPLTTLDLDFELWVMESREVGGRFTFTNKVAQPQALRLELFGQIAPLEGKPPVMNLLGLDDGTEALHLGKLGGLNPVLMLEFAVPGQPPAPVVAWEAPRTSPKLSAPITVPANGSLAVRWVHAGYSSVEDSLKNAYQRLYKSAWDEEIAKIPDLPVIETGNADWDATIAFTGVVTLRSFISGNSLPHPTLVAARIPSRGFSAHGDGSDHGRQWNGASAYLTYLAAPSAAILAPE